MKAKNYFLILVVMSVLPVNILGQKAHLAKNPADKLEISILYDNYVCTEGTKADWGFSALIDADGQQILFDTGTKPDILMKNVEVTQTDLSTVDQVIISHNHGDHTGGLWTVLSKKTDIPVYLPYPPDDQLVSRTKELRGHPESKGNVFKLSDHVWSSGTMGDNIHEQCVVIHHEKGLIVVTGCSHPGITYMLEKIIKDFGQDIYAVMGGFHLMQHSKKQIEEIIAEFRALGIKKCGCTHCTGDKQIQQFREAFGKDFIEMGTGRRIVI